MVRRKFDGGGDSSDRAAKRSPSTSSSSARVPGSPVPASTIEGSSTTPAASSSARVVDSPAVSPKSSVEEEEVLKEDLEEDDSEDELELDESELDAIDSIQDSSLIDLDIRSILIYFGIVKDEATDERVEQAYSKLMAKAGLVSMSKEQIQVLSPQEADAIGYILYLRAIECGNHYIPIAVAEPTRLSMRLKVFLSYYDSRFLVRNHSASAPEDWLVRDDRGSSSQPVQRTGDLFFFNTLSDPTFAGWWVPCQPIIRTASLYYCPTSLFGSLDATGTQERRLHLPLEAFDSIIAPMDVNDDSSALELALDPSYQSPSTPDQVLQYCCSTHLVEVHGGVGVRISLVPIDQCIIGRTLLLGDKDLGLPQL